MRARAASAVLLLLALTSCTKKLDRQVQETVRQFDNALLSSDKVEVLSVQESGDHVLAEIKVATAVKMVKREGTWIIEEIRIGDRRWEKAEHILALINEKRSETTRQQLDRLSKEIERFADLNQQVPQVTSFERLIDVLSPDYLDEIIRIDAWSRPFSYRRLSPDGYDLRSAGPDGKLGTPDDLIPPTQ